MNVKQLRELLADLPDDFEVIVQKDSEGNGYSPAVGVVAGKYVPDSTWAGEFWEQDGWKDWCQDQGDYDESEKFVENAVVIWPTY